MHPFTPAVNANALVWLTLVLFDTGQDNVLCANLRQDSCAHLGFGRVPSYRASTFDASIATSNRVVVEASMIQAPPIMRAHVLTSLSLSLFLSLSLCLSRQFLHTAGYQCSDR
jgi:hypothetical protein